VITVWSIEVFGCVERDPFDDLAHGQIPFARECSRKSSLIPMRLSHKQSDSETIFFESQTR